MNSDNPRRVGLGSVLVRWLRKGLAALAVAVIDSITDSIDSALVMLPNPVPTAGQLRDTRKRGGLQLRRLGRVTYSARRPVLAGVGAGELLVHRWRPASTGLV